MPSDPTAYVVYFDRIISRENKIHRTSCPDYLRHDPEADTTSWDERPYQSRQAAVEATGVTRGCGNCNP